MTPVIPDLSWAEGRLAAKGMRRLREEQGLTQQALGARTGMSKNQVSVLERGAARVHREAAEKAAVALGTDLAGLLAAGGAT